MGDTMAEKTVDQVLNEVHEHAGDAYVSSSTFDNNRVEIMGKHMDDSGTFYPATILAIMGDNGWTVDWIGEKTSGKVEGRYPTVSFIRGDEVDTMRSFQGL